MSNRRVTTETFGHPYPEPTETSECLIAQVAPDRLESASYYDAAVSFFKATKHPFANDPDAVAFLIEQLFDLNHPVVDRLMQLPELAQVGVVCSTIERLVENPLVFQSNRSDIFSHINVDTSTLSATLAPGIICSFDRGNLVVQSTTNLAPDMPDVFEAIVTDVYQSIQIKTTFTRVHRLNVDNAEHLADLLDQYIA